MKQFIPVILAALWLQGCKAGPEDASTGSLKSDGALDIKATSQILPPEKIIKVSIAPKPGFAASLGQILLLGESGDIYASNTGFGGVNKVAAGNYSDILGLSRGESPSIFLALNPNGDIKPFIENTQEGFDPISLSAGDLKVDSFCQMEIPSDESVFLIVDGRLQKLNYRISGRSAIELTKTDTPNISNIASCYVSQNDAIYTSNTAGLLSITGDKNEVFSKDVSSAVSLNADLSLIQTKEANLFAQQGDKNTSLKITAGFSIPGIKKANWLYVTNASMGNTFSGGLTLVGDKADDHIVMISNEYLVKTIAEAPE